AFLVCAYAIGVLGYVLLMPEVGVRCAFTPVVNHFYAEFLYPEDQPPLRAEDRIVRVGDRDVENWSQLLRSIQLLRHQQPKEVPGLTAADLAAGRMPGEVSFVRVDGHRVVKLTYDRPGAAPGRTVWCRLGPAPLGTLVPSVLWFCIKIG